MDRSVPAGAARLLDFIYRTDAGSPPPACYAVIFGNRQNRLPKPITAMTLGELIDAQKNWASKTWVKKNWGATTASSAAGAAQFMRDTLLGMVKEMSLSAGQIFDSDFQDRLAYQLLKRRGYQQFMDGTITRTEFAKRLAMEWASFPVLTASKGASRPLKRGQSYYAGDGLNKALVAPETVEAVLDEVRALGKAIVAPPVPVQPIQAPQPSTPPPTAPVPPAREPQPLPPPSGGKTAGIFAVIAVLGSGIAMAWHHIVNAFWSVF